MWSVAEKQPCKGPNTNQGSPHLWLSWVAVAVGMGAGGTRGVGSNAGSQMMAVVSRKSDRAMIIYQQRTRPARGNRAGEVERFEGVFGCLAR